MDEWSASRFSRFTLGEWASCTLYPVPSDKRLYEPQNYFRLGGEEKISATAENRIAAVQSVTNLYAKSNILPHVNIKVAPF
jgi:hypothetical protein